MPNTRRDVVGVELDGCGQPLQVVAQPGVHREIAAQAPFVLHEQPEVGVRLELRRLRRTPAGTCEYVPRWKFASDVNV